MLERQRYLVPTRPLFGIDHSRGQWESAVISNHVFLECLYRLYLLFGLVTRTRPLCDDILFGLCICRKGERDA